MSIPIPSSQSSRPHSPAGGEVDLAIVGGGLAGTFALLGVLERLAAVPAPERAWSIVMLDREGDFFAGSPYGGRAGRASLTITALEEFLPAEELGRFVAWLEERRDAILAGSVAGEQIDREWRARHEADILAGRWEHIYVPRRLFGAYLGERAREALRRHEGLAQVTLVHAAVERLVPGGDGVRVHAGGATLLAGRVLLAVGSPPVRRLPRGGGAPAWAFVDSIHAPSLDAMLAEVRRAVSEEYEGIARLLLVGGNAEAIELIYAAHSTFPHEWVPGRLTVLSPAGRPRHWRNDEEPGGVELPALDALAARSEIRSQAIHAAVVADLAGARRMGRDLSAVDAIMSRVVPLVDRLDAEETHRFVSREGMAVSDLLRQAGGDAVDALDSRADAGAVRFEASRYAGARWEAGRGWRVQLDGDAGELAGHFAVILNATGFESVSGTRDPLLRTLLDEGVVRAAPGDRGLAVAPDFSCADGIHVAGPLLAGNTDPRVWHLESARRIIGMADRVSAVLAERLLARRAQGALAAAD